MGTSAFRKTAIEGAFVAVVTGKATISGAGPTGALVVNRTVVVVVAYDGVVGVDAAGCGIA